VKTFFARSSDWALLSCGQKPKPEVLERCIFKHRRAEVYLVADAYRGDEIRHAILDFFDAAAGASPEKIALPSVSAATLTFRGGSNLVAYIGHNGLMDFQLPIVPLDVGPQQRHGANSRCKRLRADVPKTLRPTRIDIVPAITGQTDRDDTDHVAESEATLMNKIRLHLGLLAGRAIKSRGICQ